MTSDILYKLSGDTADNRVWRNILIDNGSSSNDSIIADGYSL